MGHRRQRFTEVLDLGMVVRVERNLDIRVPKDFRHQSTGVASSIGLWETGDMRTPELIDVGWLGPRYEMDDASHRFGKCSECHEIICVEKAVTATENTQPETTEMLYKVFRTHVELKHSDGFQRNRCPKCLASPAIQQRLSLAVSPAVSGTPLLITTSS
jgi:hypothetical protein